MFAQIEDSCKQILPTFPFLHHPPMPFDKPILTAGPPDLIPLNLGDEEAKGGKIPIFIPEQAEKAWEMELIVKTQLYCSHIAIETWSMTSRGQLQRSSIQTDIHPVAGKHGKSHSPASFAFKAHWIPCYKLQKECWGIVSISDIF